MNTKKPKENQQYDQYWKLTVEYSNILGVRFNNTLKTIITFIDRNKEIIDTLSPEKYKAKDKEEKKRFSLLYASLQNEINEIYPKVDKGSVRKSINQFVKLGFIKPFFKGYHRLAKRFLSIPNEQDEMKKSIFSEIFYENASFSSSMTIDLTNTRPTNFLLKTLMYHPDKKLSKEDIIALMVSDLASFPKGYLTTDELKSQYAFSKSINFEDNKYNQIDYMFDFLKLMPNLIAKKEIGVSFIDDNVIVPDKILTRDPYLHALYRNNLRIESQNVYSSIVCYAEKVFYKGLVASHLKPCHICLSELNVDEAYDYNNGILIQPNIDAYFDKFDISFADDGSILIGNKVDKTYAAKIKDYKLDKEILNKDRLKYLTYHRNEYYKKNAC